MRKHPDPVGDDLCVVPLPVLSEAEGSVAKGMNEHIRG